MAQGITGNRGEGVLSKVRRNYQVYLLLLPCLVYVLIFCYGPMYGVQIAFKNFNTGLGIWGSDWVGLKHFRRFLTYRPFWRVVKNTLFLSVYNLLAGFPIPIIVALMMNEVRQKWFKKAVQTITYAPHFISTVVLAAMITLFLSPGAGVVNKLIELFGGEPVYFMSRPEAFPHIYVISGVWQHFGWGTIIYLAALSGVDESLHESAVIDGASRLQRIWHINLPWIAPTIVIQLILSLGGILGSDFTKILLLQNDSILDTAQVLSTYTYELGIRGAQFSLASAMGLFNSLVNLVILVMANEICRRLGDTSLW